MELEGIFNRSLFNDSGCTELPNVEPYPEPSHIRHFGCQLKFLSYHMSKLENHFYSNLNKSWAKGSNQEYCNFLADPYVVNSFRELVATMGRYNKMRSLKHEQVNTDIFSRMKYRMKCEGEDEVIFDTYIEPLVGMTRHPWACDCNHTGYLMDLSYILTQTFEDNPYYSRVGRNIRYTGMDLGASLWPGSQEYFLKLYDLRGRKFDRFMMWEGTNHSEETIWKNVPNKYRHTMEYNNELAILEANDPLNTFRMEFPNIRVEDYFAWKLDIDHPAELNFP